MGYWKTNAPADWTRRMGAGYVGRRGATYYEVNKVDGVWVAESYHIGADGSKNGQTRSGPHRCTNTGQNLSLHVIIKIKDPTQWAIRRGRSGR